MNNQPRYEPFPILINSFFSNVEKYFSFLKDDFAFSESKRLIINSGKEIEFKPEKFSEKIWIFMVIKHYENSKGRITISYGDKESIIELKYLRKKDKLLFGVWEIFKAKNIDFQRIAGEQFVLNQVLMKNTIVNIANNLRIHFNEIENIPDNIIDIILKNRKIVQQNYYDQLKKVQMDSDLNNASIEFKKKNFKKVIDILEKYSEDLSDSQLKKLKYSKKMLSKN